MLEILQDKEEISRARETLRDLGLSSDIGLSRLQFYWRYLLRFRAIPPGVAVNKSWDVMNLYARIDHLLPERDGKILDMGSYNSEIPISLWRGGYRDITAVDLNPLGRCINWYGNDIKFLEANYYDNELPDLSFDIVTSLSVIEHGYNQRQFLASTSRLLRPGGLLCLTTDYHESKISVPDDFRIFKLPYMIFSREEIVDLISAAEAFGLEPAGQINWRDSEYPIEFAGFKFTFLMLIFRKV